MSLQFNVTTSPFNGIIQLIEREIGVDKGYISGNATRLGHTTTDINMAWDNYLRIAFKNSGTWQFDDSNHTDYPIIYTDLVADQQDYSFTTDENSNLILDIYKIAVLPSATATVYEEIYPVDQQTKDRGRNLVEGNVDSGVPYQYDKTGNGIFLDERPSYSATNGLKIYINREASYFTTSDTTKKPGCPGNHHTYFAIKPAYEYARRNNLSITNALFNEVLKMEQEIAADFANRQRDERAQLTMKKINYV